jgi:hypothetical protein
MFVSIIDNEIRKCKEIEGHPGEYSRALIDVQPPTYRISAVQIYPPCGDIPACTQARAARLRYVA